MTTVLDSEVRDRIAAHLRVMAGDAEFDARLCRSADNGSRAELHDDLASRYRQLVRAIEHGLFDLLDATDAQRAELHVDVSDAALCDLACRACYPTAVSAS